MMLHYDWGNDDDPQAECQICGQLFPDVGPELLTVCPACEYDQDMDVAIEMRDEEFWSD